MSEGKTQSAGQADLSEGSYPFDFSALAELKALTSRDPIRFEKLVLLFLTGMADDLVSMRDALEKCDISAVKDYAHGLKGTSANMGAVHLSSLCASLEENCEGQGPDLIAGDLRALEVEAARVTALLKADVITQSGGTPGK